MTDLEKLTTLLTEFGVGFTIQADSSHTEQWKDNPLNAIVIECEEGNEKITGYGNFCAQFVFNPDGSFFKIGVWE